MALRYIFKNGAPCLRKVCKPVINFDRRLHTLLDDMAETMYHAEGAGLAASQVGVLKRVVVIDCGSGLVELVNPTVVSFSGEQKGYEGCLSFPDDRGYVVRPNRVVVRGFNRNGSAVEYEGEGLFACAVFHEIDHLNGRLFVDIATEPPEGYDDEDIKSENIS